MESHGVLCQQGRWRGPLGKVACEQRPAVLGGAIGYRGGSGGPGRGTEPGQRPGGHRLESRGATGAGGAVPGGQRGVGGARSFLRRLWAGVRGSASTLSEMGARMSQHRRDLSGV